LKPKIAFSDYDIGWISNEPFIISGRAKIFVFLKGSRPDIVSISLPFNGTHAPQVKRRPKHEANHLSFPTADFNNDGK
jgi:hypothetical protein